MRGTIKKQCPFSLDVDFENFLGENADQANTIAGTVELVRNAMSKCLEEYEKAETGQATMLARFEVVYEAGRLMPVIEMLFDYTRTNKALAMKIYDYYEGAHSARSVGGPFPCRITSRL